MKTAVQSLPGPSHSVVVVMNTLWDTTIEEVSSKLVIKAEPILVSGNPAFVFHDRWIGEEAHHLDSAPFKIDSLDRMWECPPQNLLDTLLAFLQRVLCSIKDTPDVRCKYESFTFENGLSNDSQKLVPFGTLFGWNSTLVENNQRMPRSAASCKRSSLEVSPGISEYLKWITVDMESKKCSVIIETVKPLQVVYFIKTSPNYMCTNTQEDSSYQE
ncbi:hypothetical protein C8J56DRAFT_899897 [Mycena floridula]|nr:hypothetical protein C8J56DRAFT_899897 [Mycena floridula]